VYVVDIETDPLWDEYRAIARVHGLRACWSTPILTKDGTVLGTFALYYREPKSPTVDDVQLVARATHIAGVAIENRQLEEQLRALSMRIEAVREEERTTIAREIHDELGQALTALKLDLAALGREDARLTARAKTLAAATDVILDQVRRISSELRPGVLDHLGLGAAIEWQAQEFERRTSTPCRLVARGDASLDPRTSTAVFRIFQEALTNVARHADAKEVEIVLQTNDELVSLEVRDDGRGITPEEIASRRSLGLLGMRERVQALGGELTIAGEAGVGTTLSLRVPRKAA
jgi:two-component system sensor histidine kinase UhpB